MAWGSAAALADLMSGRRPRWISHSSDADRHPLSPRRGRIPIPIVTRCMRQRWGGVERIVVPAVAVDSFRKVKTSVERYRLAAAYGIHPLYLTQAQESDLTVLRATGWNASSRWPSARSASTST